MAEAVESPEISGKTCLLLDSVYLLIDVHPFVAIATGKDVRAIGAWVGLQKLPGLYRSKVFFDPAPPWDPEY